MDPLNSQRKCDESIDTFEIFNEASNPSQPIIVSADGNICIQLEGSHTTATETDNKTKDTEDTGNLQCEVELNEVSVVKDQAEAAFDKQAVIVTEELSYELPESLEDDSLNLLPFYETPNNRDLEKLIKENQDVANKFKHIREMFDDLVKNLETLNTEPSSTTFQSNEFAVNIDHSEINNPITETETKDPKETNKFQIKNELNLAKPPAQILKHTDDEMAYKNLEMKFNVEILKFEETLAQIYLQQVEKEKDTNKTIKELGENQTTILKFTPTSSICQGNLFGGVTEKPRTYNFDYYGKEEIEMPVATDKFSTEFKESKVSVDKCSVSTEIVIEELSTVVETNQTSACQTSLNEFTSKIDLSLDGPSTSSADSKSKYQNSLNNFTHADNACLPLTPKEESLKIPSPEKLDKTFTKSASVIELTTFSEEELVENTVANPSIIPIHSIDIEATSPPSSMDFRRPPLCQRLWMAIRNFLAAAFLCLRVNRDCIFCLGFFIAFVVSASFMTAFFYRTLSMSPSLFESVSAQHFVQGGNENFRKYKIADLPRFSRV